MLLSCYCNTIDDAYVLNIVTDKFKEWLCAVPLCSHLSSGCFPFCIIGNAMLRSSLNDILITVWQRDRMYDCTTNKK